MPNIGGLIARVEKSVQQALKPTYTLDVIVKPDNPEAVTEVLLVDSDGNNRMLIGKRGNDYGIWISRRGFPLTDTLNTKYLSFTGSLLTPKLKSGAVIPMDLTSDNSPTNKVWERNQYSPSLGIQIYKDYPDEKITLVGFYRLKKADGTFVRVQINNPKECSSFFTLLHDWTTDIYFLFTLTTDSIYVGVDIEYFVFTDK